LSNSEIGRRRGTSGRTVANQMATIFRKLGVSSRAELARNLVLKDRR
jgi:DNA-binding CsgD family transcriptional regulator